MSETVPRSRMDRIRDWWLIYVILAAFTGAVGGAIAVGFTKFTIYYLAEEKSVGLLAALDGSSAQATQHLNAIDVTLRDQSYTNQTTARTLDDLAAHLHALDVRADADRQGISEALSKQDKNTQSILLLLQPRSR